MTRPNVHPLPTSDSSGRRNFDVVPHPANLEVNLVSQLDEGGNTAEQSGGAARLDQDHVGVDKEGAS